VLSQDESPRQTEHRQISRDITRERVYRMCARDIENMRLCILNACDELDQRVIDESVQ